MDEYISREAAIDKMRSLKSSFRAKNDWDSGYDTAIAEAFEHIKRVPVADVQPVKHGKWIENTYKYIKELDAYFVQAKCTVCGRYSDKIDIYTGYMSNECCSHCGARMRQEG